MNLITLIIKNVGVLSIEGEITTDEAPLSPSPALPELIDNEYEYENKNNYEFYEDENYMEKNIDSTVESVEPFNPYGPSPPGYSPFYGSEPVPPIHAPFYGSGPVPPVFTPLDRNNVLTNRKLAKEKLALKKESFFNIYYLTENKLRDRYNDDINDNFYTLRIMNGSSNLRLLLSISDQLNILPCDIRLWTCENFLLKNENKNENEKYFYNYNDIKINKVVHFSEINESIEFNLDIFYYVEILSGNNMVSDIDGIFENNYRCLRSDEEEWIKKLKQELILKNNNNNYDNDVNYGNNNDVDFYNTSNTNINFNVFNNNNNNSIYENNDNSNDNDDMKSEKFPIFDEGFNSSSTNSIPDLISVSTTPTTGPPAPPFPPVPTNNSTTSHSNVSESPSTNICSYTEGTYYLYYVICTIEYLHIDHIYSVILTL
jgi:hypothetical protein